MKTRSRNWIIAAAVFAVVYSLAWVYGNELGLSRTMANARYFYYGTAPESVSDEVLCIFFYPIYAVHLARQGNPEIHGRDFVHWSDRREPKR